MSSILDIVELRHKAKAYIDDFASRGDSINWWNGLLLATARIDARFDILKEVVAEDHLLPQELLPGAKSVIVYFIPFRKNLVVSNIQGEMASRDWAQSYVDTNSLIADLNQYLSTSLADLGYKSAVTPATHNFKPERLISGWSHKHIAFLAGLGRFGMHTQLITPSGCCGRFGSLVTEAEFGDHPLVQDGELCRHKVGRNCLACVKKCRFGALTEDGFDRFKCYEQLMKNDALYSDMPLTDVCAKCVSIVPCSFKSAITAKASNNQE